MKLIITAKKQETTGVTTFLFDAPEGTTWTAGQYAHYVLHHEPTDDRGSDRWFTIASAPFEKHLRITTRFADEDSSSFKKKLFSREVGKSIEASIIEGDFVLDDPEKSYVFIAGGIGITPYRSMIKQLDHEGKQINVTLLYANRDENVVFKDELEEIASRHPEFQIHYVLSPEHITEETVRKFVPDTNTPLFYISGPEPMVEKLGEMLKNMGIADDHLKQDWFPGYPEE